MNNVSIIFDGKSFSNSSLTMTALGSAWTTEFLLLEAAVTATDASAAATCDLLAIKTSSILSIWSVLEEAALAFIVLDL